LNPAISELVIQQKSGAECNCLSTRKCTCTRGWVLHGIASMSKDRFYANMAPQYILLVVQEPNQHGGPPGEGQSITPWRSERETGRGSFLFHLFLSVCVCMCLLCTRHHTRRGYLHPSSGLRNNFFFSFFKIG
jgi:hypothetical protein